jgi:plasmid stability protein
MQSMMIYLEPEQKARLKRRASARGGSVSREIRTAIEQYLNGATPNEVEALDALSRQAEKDLADMRDDLGNIVEMIQDAVAEIEAIRRGQAEP